MPENTRNGKTFEAWLKEVDRVVQGIVGIGQEDGCDWLSWATWNEEATPEQGAAAWAEAQDLLPEELLEAFYALAG